MSKIIKYPFSQLYDMASGISSTKEQAGHGSPFVSFSTVFNNYFLPDALPDLMDTSIKEQETYSIKKGDILITRTSETIDELAMSCVAVKDYPRATYSGFTKRLRPKTAGIAYHKYLAFYLRSQLFRKAVTNNAFMTLRASFNEDIFSFLNLYLPEYKEQVKIGDMLYSMEQKIQLNKRICAELEAMAKTLYNYWFTQFDFPDENGKPYRSSGGEMVWNDQLKRKIPKGWDVRPLSHVISSINTGLNPRDNFILGNGDIQYLTVKNLTTSGTIDFSGCDTVDEQAREIIHKRSDVSVGDILFASIAPLGRCYLIQNPPEKWDINESVFSIRRNAFRVTSEFLYMYFMSDTFIKAATSSSTGSIFKGIRINTLLDIAAVIPPKDIVTAFTTQVKTLLALKEQKGTENRELTKLRDWLLPVLMNGQATVE
jgi:type I restriction enzyme S subunit